MTDKEIVDKFCSEKYVYPKKVIQKATEEERQYIDNRYEDSESIRETLFRMKYGLEEKPVCPICGKKVKFSGHSKNNPWHHTCGDKTCMEKHRQKMLLQKYGYVTPFSKQEVQVKRKQTCTEKYGYETPAKSEKVRQKLKQTYNKKTDEEKQQIRDKIAQTNLERYGAENVYASEYGKSKVKETCLSKFGVENPQQDPEIKKKSQETILERYGVTNVFFLDKVQKEIQKTRISNYFEIDKSEINDGNIHDFLSKMQSDILIKEETQTKILESKRKNGTLSFSGIEKKFKDFLDKEFPNDHFEQYKSKDYPFNCDFYIKSLDLYIEIQGYWTHGGHPFDENNEKDLQKLEIWKKRANEIGVEGKKKLSYQTAIKVWTVADPLKREVAQKNNIKLLEIFECDIEKCVKFFKNNIWHITN